MKVAVFGCLHGMMTRMYEEIEKQQAKDNIKIELVIVCGDCQTVRHQDDLICLNVPNKYKKMGDFHEYYSGKRKVPILTIFVGGNHEASNYLMTLPYGGWVCENFYYMGYAGVIRYKGLRIAGVSGIYNHRNCNRGRFESMPLNEETIRSIYHTRKLDIFRLRLLAPKAEKETPIDVFISHDWPARIYDHGNKEQLIKFKPYFKEDIESREGLGSPLTELLVSELKPRRWFAAHLHCRFYAKVKHDSEFIPQEKDCQGDSKEEERCTEFLALNKIENKRNFMEVVDLSDRRTQSGKEPAASVNEEAEDDDDDELYYDEEWLTIVRKTYHLESESKGEAYCPEPSSHMFVVETDIKKTLELMGNNLKIERNFKMCEPVIYNRANNSQASFDRDRTRFYPNHQTEALKERLGIGIGEEFSFIGDT